MESPDSGGVQSAAQRHDAQAAFQPLTLEGVLSYTAPEVRGSTVIVSATSVTSYKPAELVYFLSDVSKRSTIVTHMPAMLGRVTDDEPRNLRSKPGAFALRMAALVSGQKSRKQKGRAHLCWK